MSEPPIIRAGFSASKGLGDLIRKFTGGDVNHAFIMYFDPVLEVDVTFGANSNGFTMVPLSDFPDEIIRYYVPLANPLVWGFRKNVHWINKPYDVAGLIGMSVVEFERHILRMMASNPFLNTHKLFCSEIVTKMLRDAGYSLLVDKMAGTIDPWTLDRALFARPDLYRREDQKE